MSVIVRITGRLKSMKRKEASNLINKKTNAVFKEKGLTHDTNYLVATNLKTLKYKRAISIGVKIISEKQMISYIKKGIFPDNS